MTWKHTRSCLPVLVWFALWKIPALECPPNNYALSLFFPFPLHITYLHSLYKRWCSPEEVKEWGDKTRSIPSSSGALSAPLCVPLFFPHCCADDPLSTDTWKQSRALSKNQLKKKKFNSQWRSKDSATGNIASIQSITKASANSVTPTFLIHAAAALESQRKTLRPINKAINTTVGIRTLLCHFKGTFTATCTYTHPDRMYQ